MGPVSKPAAAPDPGVTTRGLLDYVRPYWVRLLQGMGLLLLTQSFDQMIPVLLGRAIDALTDGRMDVLEGLILGVIGCSVAMGIVRTVSRTRIFNVARDVEFDLRNNLLAHLQRLGPSFFRAMPTGEIMSRATDETGYVQPTWDALREVRGPRTRYHQNPITSWTVGSDGRVLFGAERLRS